MMAEDEELPKSNVVQLYERVTVTFSAGTTRLIKAEIKRQRRELPHRYVDTAEELAEWLVRSHCEGLASGWSEVKS
jgi:hypothetical protein